MELGINFPWVTCGHDFGPRPPAWSSAPPTDFAAVEAELRALRDDGITCARWWILAGGVNLPVGADPCTVARREPWLDAWPRHERPFVARREHVPERWVLTAPLPPLPRAFHDDLARLLDACRASGVKLWPSLISFELLLPIEDQVGGVTSRGRADFALGDNAGAFFDATLEGVLDVCEHYRDAVEAVEIANEPGWALVAGWERARWGTHPAWTTPEILGDFLVEGCRRVARRGFVSSVGFLHADPPWLPPSAKMTLRRLAERGAYRHQTHHYPSVTGTRVLPDASRAVCEPCWVGEVATSQEGLWPELAETEHDADGFLAARLAHAERRGYAGALLWAHRSTDPHTRWDEGTRAQTRRWAEERRA